MTTSIYHQLAVWKHHDVTVVRFGEHRMLDELTVSKFGDELCHVAEQADCHNLLLNFAGVVGMSSLMVGKLIMLQRKIVARGAKLKLCDVGPELQEVVTATQLDQIFDIWDSEQDALKALAESQPISPDRSGPEVKGL
jgi:anti-sigma B factor antagonist